jgi:putative flavoprotein involved in K+ transport
MLGGQERDAYAPGAEVVERLAALAADAPVREGVEVSVLARVGDGYAVRSRDAEVRARAVVVATGDQNVPRVPAVARAFPATVEQLHAADYRNADRLPDGAVLVVGSAQSGCQIAEDLVAAGRRVVLATSPVGRLPTPYRGRDTVDWLAEAGFFDQRPSELPDPSAMHAAQPVVAPGGRSLDLRALARAGVTLMGRPVGVAGKRVAFDDSVQANVAAGDGFARRVRAIVDDVIRRRGLDAPPAEPDHTEPAIGVESPAELDLRDVGAVIWSTGFTGDFSWLGPELLDADGLPRREQTASPAPGVWFVGLRWLTRRGSALLHGFPGDAAVVADAARGLVARTVPG